MAGQVYQAFVEAGFEKEARQLSTTIEGKVVSALGHAIAVVDGILDSERQFSNRDSNIDRTILYDKCVKNILGSAYTFELSKSLHEIFLWKTRSRKLK